MKKALILLVTFLALTALTSCRQEEVQPQPYSVQQAQDITRNGEDSIHYDVVCDSSLSDDELLAIYRDIVAFDGDQLHSMRFYGDENAFADGLPFAELAQSSASKDPVVTRG